MASSATLYFNGKIVTCAGDKPEYAEAVVTNDDSIVFVGALDAAKSTFPNGTPKDLAGKTLVPGFIDPHSHFFQSLVFSTLLTSLHCDLLNAIRAWRMDFGLF